MIDTKHKTSGTPAARRLTRLLPVPGPFPGTRRAVPSTVSITDESRPFRAVRRPGGPMISYTGYIRLITSAGVTCLDVLPARTRLAVPSQTGPNGAHALIARNRSGADTRRYLSTVSALGIDYVLRTTTPSADVSACGPARDRASSREVLRMGSEWASR